MTLSFKNSQGKMRLIREFDNLLSHKDILHLVQIEIDNFCAERNYKIYYMRTWNTKYKDTTVTVFDVGSHTEFFYLSPSVNIEQ